MQEKLSHYRLVHRAFRFLIKRYFFPDDVYWVCICSHLFSKILQIRCQWFWHKLVSNFITLSCLVICAGFAVWYPTLFLYCCFFMSYNAAYGLIRYPTLLLVYRSNFLDYRVLLIHNAHLLTGGHCVICCRKERRFLLKAGKCYSACVELNQPMGISCISNRLA